VTTNENTTHDNESNKTNDNKSKNTEYNKVGKPQQHFVAQKKKKGTAGRRTGLALLPQVTHKKKNSGLCAVPTK